MVLVKNHKFLYCFFPSTFGLETIFCDVLYRKLAFLQRQNGVISTFFIKMLMYLKSMFI